MSSAAEQRSPAGLLLQWSEERGQWSGELEDGPFRLTVVAEYQGGGHWAVLLRDFTGRVEMMRETLAIELPEGAPANELVERLQELGDQWREDPGLIFTGLGHT